MPTPQQLKELRGSPRMTALDVPNLSDVVADLVEAAGIPVPASTGAVTAPVSLLVFSQDGATTRTWLIPDENLDAVNRAWLEQLHGSYFEAMFVNDLLPEKFQAAVVLLARVGVFALGGRGDGLYDDIAEGLAVDGITMPAVDFPSITGNVWGAHDASIVGLRGVPLTHFYFVQLAM